MAEREVLNIKPVVVSTGDNVHQYFRCLKSLSEKLICCKLVLEYPEGVQLPNNIGKELKTEFELYLSLDQAGCDGSSPLHPSDSNDTEGNSDTWIRIKLKDKVRAWLYRVYIISSCNINNYVSVLWLASLGSY